MLAIAGPLVFLEGQVLARAQKEFYRVVWAASPAAPECAYAGGDGMVVLMSLKSPFLCHILPSSLRMDCCNLSF